MTKTVTLWSRVGVTGLALALLAGCGGSQPKSATPVSTTPAPVQTTPAPATSTAPATAGGHYTIGADSSASYSVGERFLDKNRDNVAVGKTSGVKGEFVLDSGKLGASTVTVDMTTLKTDSSQRDKRVQKALETDKYPTAEFKITGADGAAIAEGQTADLKLSGQMKIHGTEKPLTFAAKVTQTGGTLHVTGTVSFKMTDFGVQPPNVLNLIAVQDEVKVDVDVTAKQ